MHMSASGTLIGRYVGERLGRFAEAAGGLALFLIGLRILVEHADRVSEERSADESCHPIGILSVCLKILSTHP